MAVTESFSLCITDIKFLTILCLPLNNRNAKEEEDGPCFPCAARDHQKQIQSTLMFRYRHAQSPTRRSEDGHGLADEEADQ